ncbi:MAG: sodium:solute symporter family protein [Bacteroidota bacterium]
MRLTALDWTLIGGYFAVSAALGAVYARRAGKSTQEFFLSGRNLPWWLAGTSMVATTFAADTPLAVTELTASGGIAGNWLWWNMAFGSMLTVFFFARLWRRAGIMTDVELAEIRYAGRPAAFLRGFRALYLGLFLNCIIMGWVNLAMAGILEGLFGIPHDVVLWYVAGAMLLTALYSAASGLWGVAVTDVFQFAIAMAGTVALAVVVLGLPEVGGVAGLREKLPPSAFSMLPRIGGEPAGAGTALAIGVSAFFAFVAVQWWASWYPGAEPGGGGYVAQRMMSARNETHALLATLWFTIAHYCLRPWPWILTALAALVLYPGLPEGERKLAYVYAMRDHLPPGLLGLLVAAFLAAYMSTIATHLNWGTSYVIHDFYRRFIRPAATERHYVAVSRITTAAVMLLSLAVTARMETIQGAWVFIIEAGAGLGLVLILRWYWWRVNAWSEIAAMIAPCVGYAVVRFLTPVRFPESLFLIVGFTTAAWLAATFLTPPTDAETLKSFYRRVHPGGLLWKRIALQVPEVKGDSGFGRLFLLWCAGVAAVYLVLFGVGHILLGESALGGSLLAGAALAAWVITAGLKADTRSGASAPPS